MTIFPKYYPYTHIEPFNSNLTTAYPYIQKKETEACHICCPK